MRCEGCGLEALAMKTVRRRSGERRFVLCDPCYAPIRGSLWIVPGEVSVVAKCLACGAYLHPEGMASLAGGGDGKRDVLAGTCRFHGYGDPRLGYDAERDLYSFPDGRFALLGVSDKPCSLGIPMNRGKRGEGRSARPRPSSCSPPRPRERSRRQPPPPPHSESYYAHDGDASGEREQHAAE